MISKSLDLVGGPVLPRFSTPVVFVLSKPIIYGGIGVEFGVGTVKELLKMGVELGLIGLDGQHVVGLLFDDLFGRAFMTPQGIGGDQAAFEV